MKFSISVVYNILMFIIYSIYFLEKDDDGLLELNLDTEEANRLENCIIYAIFTIFFLFVFIFVLYLIHMKTFNDYPATGDEITLWIKFIVFESTQKYGADSYFQFALTLKLRIATGLIRTGWLKWFEMIFFLTN